MQKPTQPEKNITIQESKSEFQDWLDEILLVLDKIYAEKQMSLHERKFNAACKIVERFIIKVENDEEFKENFWEKFWFAALYNEINNWYEKRYVTSLNLTTHSIKGLAFCFGAFFSAEIPCTVGHLHTEDSVWFSFPREILKEENPIPWIKNPPNIESLQHKNKEAFLKDFKNISRSLRNIYTNLIGLDCPDQSLRNFANGITRHLENAAHNAAANEPTYSSLFMWEITMACEKAIKFYLMQNKVSFPKTHDLKKLHRIANSKSEFNKANKEFIKLPSASQSIQYRYGEISAPPPSKMAEAYNAALNICVCYSSKFKHQFLLGDKTKFLIKTPPWQKQISYQTLPSQIPEVK